MKDLSAPLEGQMELPFPTPKTPRWRCAWCMKMCKGTAVTCTHCGRDIEWVNPLKGQSR